MEHVIERPTHEGLIGIVRVIEPASHPGIQETAEAQKAFGRLGPPHIVQISRYHCRLVVLANLVADNKQLRVVRCGTLIPQGVWRAGMQAVKADADATAQLDLGVNRGDIGLHQKPDLRLKKLQAR
jgi:hypothetical protein